LFPTLSREETDMASEGVVGDSGALALTVPPSDAVEGETLNTNPRQKQSNAEHPPSWRGPR
jgi:hypothetical protein